ncbi:hypothetical protein BGZ76_005106 [Entomortierella beljakovae]|nr:hypothetical protein BGZ76_005106 [Entomortierella beljakovae]
MTDSFFPIPQIRVSLEGVDVRNGTTEFWTSLGDALRISCDDVKSISSRREFLNSFSRASWNEKVIIFIDEFDELLDADDIVRNECLQAFRLINNQNSDYAIQSVVACGTFSLRFLNSSDNLVSSFNVDKAIMNPYFTLKQTQRLFHDYADTEKISLDDDIVRDIFLKSNGHPGMVCLCGEAIAENLRSKVNLKTKNLDYQTWYDFSTDQQNEKIFSYKTFQRMVNSLMMDSANGAVDLLRTRFIGYLDDVSVMDD